MPTGITIAGIPAADKESREENRRSKSPPCLPQTREILPRRTCARGCAISLSLFLKRGRREGRAPNAPVDPVRRSARASRAPEHTGKDYRYSRPRRPSPRDVWRLIRALPGERPFLSPLPTPHSGADRRQGRGARTTRLRRPPRTLRLTGYPARRRDGHRIPHPTIT